MGIVHVCCVQPSRQECNESGYWVLVVQYSPNLLPKLNGIRVSAKEYVKCM